MYPRPQVESPFDPVVIHANIERLQTVPEVDTGHPYLDLSVKTGLAFIDATFQGDHPKYGVDAYGAGVIAPYCLPCQLVAARAARLLVAE